MKAKGTVPGWRYLTVSLAPSPRPHGALGRRGTGEGGTRSVKRGRGHLHARCSPPSHRSSVHCLVFLRTPTPDPLYMPPPAPHHLRLAPSRPPTSASRGPDPFVLPSAVDPSSAPPPPIADPFLGEPPFAPPLHEFTRWGCRGLPCICVLCSRNGWPNVFVRDAEQWVLRACSSVFPFHCIVHSIVRWVWCCSL